MKPRKQLIEAARANGAMDRLNMLFSAVQILNCEANALVEEASELMAENGMMIGGIKQDHNSFVRAADRYFHTFSTLVTTEESKMDMFRDLDHFDNFFRIWARLKEQPKKPSKMHGCLRRRSRHIAAARCARSACTSCGTGTPCFATLAASRSSKASRKEQDGGTGNENTKRDSQKLRRTARH